MIPVSSRRLVALLTLGAAACAGLSSVPPPVERAEQVATRELGAWNGTGSTTLGFVSESGSFRISWTAQNEDVARPGHFMLTLRSGISGRPLKVIAEHRSAGGGSVEFGDDPRMYEFLVESSGIRWSVSVLETFAPKGP
jgi:outer membrane biogenesis lipoprotein LolB